MKYPLNETQLAASYSPDGGITRILICAPTMPELRTAWALLAYCFNLDESKVMAMKVASMRKPTEEEMK